MEAMATGLPWSLTVSNGAQTRNRHLNCSTLFSGGLLLTISRRITKSSRTSLHGLWSATSIDLHIIEYQDPCWGGGATSQGARATADTGCSQERQMLGSGTPTVQVSHGTLLGVDTDGSPLVRCQLG